VPQHARFSFLESNDMQPTEGYVTAEDGVHLYFQKLGNGAETLVLLNGYYLFEDFKYLAEGRTLVSLDLRNRGRSDYITDGSKLQRGIQQDVDDLEAVRSYLGLSRIDLIGHSYAGIIPILYAMKYPDGVNRIVQISPMPPNARTQYPAGLTNTDATLMDFFKKVGELEKQRQSTDPKEFCRKFWEILRPIYVADPADAHKIRHWEQCNLPTELNLMKYWSENINPSIQRLDLKAEDFAKVTGAVLVVHGAKDRSSPYGGGRDWAQLLPNARLLTAENAAHAPWIEAPEVLNGIQTFLEGA
jgi:proline iminopeptidase